MNYLADLIMANELTDDADAENWQAIVDALNAPTVERLDETLRSTIWLSQTFSEAAGPPGWTEADLIIASLRDASNPPRVGEALQTMTNRENGISFAAPEVQGMIDLLATRDAWPGDLAARVKAYGRQLLSPAAAAGLDPATVESVTFAWGCHVETSAAMAIADGLRSRGNNIGAWVDVFDSDGMTLEEVRAHFADVLATADGNPTPEGQ